MDYRPNSGDVAVLLPYIGVVRSVVVVQPFLGRSIRDLQAEGFASEQLSGVTAWCGAERYTAHETVQRVSLSRVLRWGE